MIIVTLVIFYYFLNPESSPSLDIMYAVYDSPVTDPDIVPVQGQQKRGHLTQELDYGAVRHGALQVRHQCLHVLHSFTE